MKKNKKIIYSLIAVAVITVVTVILLPGHKKIHHANMEHSSDHDHDKKIYKHTIDRNPTTVLSEAGTDPFAVIHEVIALLEANPDTDWSAVNIEALRLHLYDHPTISLYFHN